MIAIDTGDLLTDPQVMTHPYAPNFFCWNKYPRLKFRLLSKWGNFNDTLFGEGNINTAFEAFTVQHQCNKYCEWFQLEEFNDDDPAPALIHGESIEM